MPETTTQLSPPRLRLFGLAALALVLGFAVPLWHLARFVVNDELHSYIPLIPLVSFIWSGCNGKNCPALPRRRENWPPFFAPAASA